MNSQIHPIQDVQNHQINNEEELEQLNIQQIQQVAPQVQQMELNQQLEQQNQNDIVQDQEPQLQSQLEVYLNDQKNNLILYSKFLGLQLVYFISELSLFITCYTFANSQLSMFKSLFIVIVVLDLITSLEMLFMIKNSIKYQRLANDGFLPFSIRPQYDIYLTEQEIKLRDLQLLSITQIRKLFEIGCYIYASISFYLNIDNLQSQSELIYVSLIIYLTIRGLVLISDILNLIKSGEKMFQGDIVANTDLHSELWFIIFTSFVYVAEIIYLIVVTNQNQHQCNGFNTFYYVTLTIDSLIIIHKVLTAVEINKQINQNIQVPFNLGIYQIAVFLRTKEIKIKQLMNFTIQILYIVNFVFCAIAISQNTNSQCQLGDSDFNLQWAFALYFLIIRVLVIGVPTIFIIFSLMLLLLLQVAQNYTFQQNKNVQHQVIQLINQNYLQRIKYFSQNRKQLSTSQVRKTYAQSVCRSLLKENSILDLNAIMIISTIKAAYLIGYQNDQTALNADNQFDFDDIFFTLYHMYYVGLQNDVSKYYYQHVAFRIYQRINVINNIICKMSKENHKLLRRPRKRLQCDVLRENSVYLNSSPVRKKIEKSAQKNLEAISSFQTLDNYWIPSTKWDDGRNRTSMSTNQRKISRNLTDSQTPVTRFEIRKTKPASLNKIQKPIIQYPIQRRLDSLNAQLVMLQGMSEFLGNDKFISSLIRRQPHNRQLSSLSFGI